MRVFISYAHADASGFALRVAAASAVQGTRNGRLQRRLGHVRGASDSYTAA